MNDETPPADQPAAGEPTAPSTSEPSEVTAAESTPDVPSADLQPEAATPDESPSEESPAAEDAPSQRGLKIGSQRPSDTPTVIVPKPVAPAAPRRDAEALEAIRAARPKPAGEKVPMPNIREALSDELEAEVAAALGDESLEDVVSSDSTISAEQQLDPDTRLEAVIEKVHRDDVFVNLGGRNQGAIPLKLFTEDPVVGATREVIVGRYNREDGLYELTIPGAAIDVGDWSDVSEGLTVDAVVTGHNKGGLECEVNKLRGFMPMSQISLYRVENPEEFVGQKLQCIVTEVNPEKRNLVLSHRGIMEREQAEKKEQLMQELAVGQVRDGIVRRVLDFGAFVDLGGVDGMIPIGQMSWDRVKHPSEVLSEGQAVKVKVERINADDGKISLAYRETWENPWDSVEQKYHAKSVVAGTVTKIMEFGAFVRLEPGIEGLIHISELDHRRVHRVADIVSEGQEVEVQVVSVDTDAQRIGLSLKALQARPEPKKKEPEFLEPEEDLPPPPVSNISLKGGFDRPTGGESLGLNW